MIKEHRQSGRTTRIANFVVEQLFSVGHCIVADHTAFEYPDQDTERSTSYLILLVQRLYNRTNYKQYTISTKLLQVENYQVVYFWIENNPIKPIDKVVE